MTQIMNAYLGLQALRQTGYRSVGTAIAELIDNSIEANASQIDIIAISREVMLSQRTSNQVQKIAVLDNGDGMAAEVLGQCLSLGWGTRLESRKGLGRFGFGLKGSSISQARRVDVYSWVKQGEVYRAHLDLDDVKDKQLDLLPKVERCDLPDEICHCFKDGIGDTGTLVLWSNLDQLDVRKAKTLMKRIDDELCRVYRYFLDNSNDYVNQVTIHVHKLQAETSSIIDTKKLEPNDPLYQMIPNNSPGYREEATNKVIEEPFTVDFEYDRGGEVHTSPVEFRFTIAKPSIQKLGGNSALGIHYGENMGISFVRAGREIDFGGFGFIAPSEPRNRWWGAEVRFSPELDELFGVTNDKQQVRNIRITENNIRREMKEVKEDDLGGDFRSKLILGVNKVLQDHIDKMMEIIKKVREGEKGGRTSSGVEARVNVDIKKSTTATGSQAHADSLTPEEKKMERVNVLLKDDAGLGEDEAETIADKTIDYRVDVLTGNWPGSLFLDTRAVANAYVGIINRDTQFYEIFWRHLEGHKDQKGFEALKVLMLALVRAEDELTVTHGKEIFEEFRQEWGRWVEKLIRHAGN